MSTLVVGAGFSGATIARSLHDAGEDVQVVDERTHIGGTAYDFLDAAGIRVATHGAHLFHSNAYPVVEFLSRFTEWTPFEHRVLADVHGQLVPMPINRQTINTLFGLDLHTPVEVAHFLQNLAEPGDSWDAETQITTKVGRRLFNLLYRDYTKKQWGCDAKELSSYVTGRLPVRYDDDDRYFTDKFQAQPTAGWATAFVRMLDGIDVTLGVKAVPGDAAAYDRAIWTGPIDAFCDYDAGPLPFRSVRFEHETFPGEQLRLPRGVINYCGPEPYTRRIEWRHLSGQDSAFSTISTEFPEAVGEPHYPVPCRASWDLYRHYAHLASGRAPNVFFAGRLGSYRYMTMDQTIAQGLKLVRGLVPVG
jgi:UDP-galactopyranose mutase